MPDGAPGSHIIARKRVIRAEETDAILPGGQGSEKARQSAEQTERALRQQADEAVQSARRRGYDEGRREALRAASALILKVRTAVEKELNDIEPEVSARVMAIVRNVLGDLPVEEKVAAATREALAKLRRARSVEIRVAPDCRSRVEETLEAMAREGRPLPHLSITSDETLPPDGCRLVSDLGTIDADVSLQLEAIEIALAEYAPKTKGTS